SNDPRSALTEKQKPVPRFSKDGLFVKPLGYGLVGWTSGTKTKGGGCGRPTGGPSSGGASAGISLASLPSPKSLASAIVFPSDTTPARLPAVFAAIKLVLLFLPNAEISATVKAESWWAVGAHLTKM